MYQYFGYDMVDDILNQKYRFKLYVSKRIFLVIKSPHKIPQNSVVLHFYQFIANIRVIYDADRNIAVSVQSIDNTIRIRSTV